MNGWLGSVLGFATLLAVGLAVAIALATWFVAHRLRHPPRRTAAWAIAKGVASDPGEMSRARAFTEWSIDACPVWDIAGDAPNGPAMILTPGWGDSRLGALVRVARLAPMCSRLITWDSPGLGDAPGACALGTREHETLRALIERAGDDAPIVLYGWSLGAGTSIVTATDNPRIAGVIAEAPYRHPWTPAFRVLEGAGYPWRINGNIAFALLGWRLGVGPRWASFDRARHAANVRAPLLVIHGGDDVTCPLDDGQAVAGAAPKGRIAVIEGAGHNDLWTDDRYAAQCADACAAFLREVTGSPVASGE